MKYRSPFFLIFFLLLLLNSTQGFGQRTNIHGLDTTELRQFEKRAIKMFERYENYLVNILDKNASDRDRLYSINRATALFNRGADIQDDFMTPTIPKTMKRDPYFAQLNLMGKNSINISKNMKRSDEVELDFVSGPTSLGVNIEDRKNQFTIYKGELSFSEYFALSDTIGALGNLSANNVTSRGKKMIKKIELEIRRNLEGHWKIFISGIDVIKKGNVDYKDRRKETKKGGELTTKEKVEENNLGEIDDEAIAEILNDPGLTPKEREEIKIAIDSASTEIVVKKLPPYRGATLLDYAIPGKGHLKYNRGFKRYGTAAIYFGATLACVVPATYYKIRSKRNYDRHLRTSTFRELDIFYDLANEDHHRFLYFSAGAILIATANAVHLFVKDRKQKRRYKKENIFEKYSNIQLQPKLNTLEKSGELTLSFYF